MYIVDEEIDVLTEKVDELEKTLEVEREESSAKIKDMEIKATENVNVLRAEVTLLSKILWIILISTCVLTGIMSYLFTKLRKYYGCSTHGTLGSQ